MKTRILSLGILLISLSGLRAQCTVDNNNVTNGFSPLPTQFPCIERGVATTSAHTMQVYVPAALDLPLPIPLPISINVNYVEITGINGLPAGITYNCNPTNCTFLGGIPGCIRLNGTTNEPAGNFFLTMDGSICLSIPVIGDTCLPLALLDQLLGNLPIPLPIPSFTYSVDVIEAGAACRLNSIGETLLNAELNVYPNPATDQIQLSINAGRNLDGVLSLSNALGQQLISRKMEVNGSLNESISLKGFAAGLYVLRYQTAEGNISRSIQIQ